MKPRIALVVALGAVLVALLVKVLLSSAPVAAPVAIKPVVEGQMCGGIAAILCTAGLWCEANPGECRMPDHAGTCRTAPEICTREYRPVCGCDGKTYPNDCDRRANKVSLDHEGPCGG